MFEIEYKGANSIIISTKKARLVIDPKLSVVGLKDVSVKEAIELATEERFVVDDQDAKLIIDGPGEYGISGFDIRGIAARRHIDTENEGLNATIYRVGVGDSRVGILGNVYEELSDEQLEELGVIDILIIPVGGNGYTLDATGATSLTRQISPKVVIPVHYADKALNYEVPQGDLKLFITELGVDVETVSKYKVKQVPVTASGTLTIIELTRS